MRLLRWLSLKRRACLCNPSLLWLRLFLIIRNEWASVSVAPAHLVYRPHVDKESPPPNRLGKLGGTCPRQPGLLSVPKQKDCLLLHLKKTSKETLRRTKLCDDDFLACYDEGWCILKNQNPQTGATVIRNWPMSRKGIFVVLRCRKKDRKGLSIINIFFKKYDFPL